MTLTDLIQTNIFLTGMSGLMGYGFGYHGDKYIGNKKGEMYETKSYGEAIVKSTVLGAFSTLGGLGIGYLCEPSRGYLVNFIPGCFIGITLGCFIGIGRNLWNKKRRNI